MVFKRNRNDSKKPWFRKVRIRIICKCLNVRKLFFFCILCVKRSMCLCSTYETFIIEMLLLLLHIMAFHRIKLAASFKMSIIAINSILFNSVWTKVQKSNDIYTRKLKEKAVFYTVFFEIRELKMWLLITTRISSSTNTWRKKKFK